MAPEPTLGAPKAWGWTREFEYPRLLMTGTWVMLLSVRAAKRDKIRIHLDPISILGYILDRPIVGLVARVRAAAG
jgi:hypothetical protein